MAIPVAIPKNSPWKTQRLVVFGLFVRECKTRLGPGNFGIIWTLLKPLMSVLVIGILLAPFMGRSAAGIPYAMFLLLGFLPFELFGGIVNSSLTAFTANQGLIVHRKVRPTDPIYARVLFELVVTVLAFLIFLGLATFIFDATPTFSDPMKIFGAFLAVTLMGTGLGFFSAVSSHRHKDMEKLIPNILRPMFFLSCVIYPLEVIPNNFQKYLLANPFVHVHESLRVSLYPHYRTGDVNVIYPIAVGLAVFWFGMAFYRVNRHILYDLE
ncbi:MAG: ABC transporter permease [Verrucomicrobiota bacterium]